MEEAWFDKFSKHLNVVFTEEDFKIYSIMVKKELPIYKKYLKKSAKLLDLGCGLGCMAVPLSKLGYKIIGIDNDAKVIEAAKKNGKNFGGKIEFMLMNIFDIDKNFGKNSFDACIHGGLLEHFSKKDIRKLVDKQLFVAPLIICSMPVRTDRTLKHYKVKKRGNKDVCVDVIKRNLWTKNQWINDVLKDYNIVESKTSKCNPKIGSFDEFLLVIKR